MQESLPAMCPGVFAAKKVEVLELKPSTFVFPICQILFKDAVLGTDACPLGRSGKALEYGLTGLT